MIDVTDIQAAIPPSKRGTTLIAQESTHGVFKVGVVGLGRMGSVFARELACDGYSVTAYDRHPERIESLGTDGVRAAAGLGDLAGCEVVVTSLPNDEALSAVTLGEGGLLAHLRPGAIHLSMSTISPALATELAQAHAAHGQVYVAAPVLGNPDLAAVRKLFVLAAGEPAARERVMPILERLGQRVFVIGDDPAAAHLMKLCGNVLTAITLQSMGEVLALARRGGIGAQVAFEVLTGSLFDGRVHKTYGGKIVDGRYDPPGMTVALAAKDLRLAVRAGEWIDVPMPAASLVHDRLVAAQARGLKGMDWSALGLLAAMDAGLDPLAQPVAAQA